MRTILLALILAVVAIPALASDGVLEINQTCAVQTGCFDGDPPGFPVLITGVAGNSYRLTSNLAVGIGNPDTDGIFINTARITLDLNGFTMSGSKFLSSTGTGVAINGGTTVGTAASFLTLKDGAVRGWAGGGVAIPEADGVRIEDIVFDFNDGNSIEIGEEAQILRNRISDGGATAQAGIVAGNRSRITENVVSGMVADGALCGDGCTVTRNTASGNGDNGFEIGDGSIILGNTASDNGGDGIKAGTGSTVSANSAFENGDDGIETSLTCTVNGNTVRENGGDQIQTEAINNVYGNTVRTLSSAPGWGLNLSALSTSYRDNVIYTGPGPSGTVNSGTDAGGNVCNGSLICP